MDVGFGVRHNPRYASISRFTFVTARIRRREALRPTSSHRIIGHSLGGFLAAYGGAHDRAVMATELVSAVSLGSEASSVNREKDYKVAGCTAVVFREHYFWLLDCSNAAAARGRTGLPD
jgi:pimeloyl-ACP methyl ester carboxylesterase